MKRLLTSLFAALTLSVAVFAADHEIVKVWPDGAPNDTGIRSSEKDSIEWCIINEPVMHIFPAEKPVGKVVLMCPGGGYRHLGMENEGYSFAPWYNEQGIDVVILQYRMPNGHHDVPLSDVHQAMRYVRGRFPGALVGIQGFSAGGHLAATAATHYDDAVTRPDFQILFYPVIAVSGPNSHPWSSKNLLGENPSQELCDLYNNHLRVTADNPPAFILHSSDDTVVPISNSLDYYAALVRNGVSASLHVYPIGGHGWGFYDGFAYKPMWSAELKYWLSTLNK